MESWRKWARDPKNFIVMNRAWGKLEKLGRANELVKNAETEEDWAKVLEVVLEWGEADMEREARTINDQPIVDFETVPGIVVQ